MPSPDSNLTHQVELKVRPPGRVVESGPVISGNLESGHGPEWTLSVPEVGEDVLLRVGEEPHWIVGDLQ